MQLDTVTAEIRPRSDWEAVDLGLAMVRRDFWRCFSVWWLAMVPPTAIVGYFLWDSPILWLLVFWWWKPAGSRMVLFELSRRLFGEEPGWLQSLRRIPGTWVRRFFYRFVWARFSPWLPVTMAVEDLEGLRGLAYRQRCAQVSRRGESVVMWIYLAADLAACWLGMAIVVLVGMFLPEGQDGPWRMAMETWNPDTPMDIPVLIMRSVVLCVMVAISLTDVFVSGCGFGVYINNRTAIEGWDVELAFKRLARRLNKVAMVLIALLVISLPAVSQELEESAAEQTMREVKADPAFKVHTVTERVPNKPASKGFWDWLHFGSLPSWFAEMFMISSLGLIGGVVAWVIWKNRHAFVMGTPGALESTKAPSARVVMGMEVSPESLPSDIPECAWKIWQNGNHQDALGLLYRGAISRVMEVGRVEIQESDTEGDCMLRVDQAGDSAHPGYFRGITGAWMLEAYGGRHPNDAVFEQLCKQWPFKGKGAG